MSMLQRVREHGRSPGIVLHLGAGRDAWAVRASLMAAEPGLRYLLHIAPVGGRMAISATPPRDLDAIPLEVLIDRLPDGFVVVSEDGVILRANAAFLDLVQAGAAGTVIGEKLGRWLSEPGADVGVLLDNVQRHHSVRLFQTTLYGELGGTTRVEVSAAGDGDGQARYFGMFLRDIGRRLPDTLQKPVDTVMDDVAEQLGKAPLLQVVKAAADAVERNLIKAALDRVDGNRTAAAELLGLSRQSLHAKLNRHAAEIEDLATPIERAM
jgi:transcriptional regulator PpsR